MKIERLIEVLRMYPADMDVFIQTVPEDYMAPLELRNFSMTPAIMEDATWLRQSKLVMTAHYPEKK